MASLIEPLPRGAGLSRFVRSLVVARGELAAAAEHARAWPDSPGVRLTLEKAATTGLTTADGLAEFGIAAELYELYRHESLVGRLSDRMRRAPFLTKVPAEQSGILAAWVPEDGGFKPARALSLEQVELPHSKLACLAVFSDELARRSTPAAEQAVRSVLLSAVSRFVDSQFLGSAAAVAGESPGGIAAGQQTQVSSGSSAAQVRADLAGMVSKLGSWESPAWLTRPRTLGHLASLDLVEYLPAGPLVWGFPVFTSAAAPAALLLADLRALYLADDGESNLSLSRQSSILMDDGLSPSSETRVSLWQQNMVALRVERWISWVAAHDAAVVSMTVSY